MSEIRTPPLLERPPRTLFDHGILTDPAALAEAIESSVMYDDEEHTPMEFHRIEVETIILSLRAFAGLKTLKDIRPKP